MNTAGFLPWNSQLVALLAYRMTSFCINFSFVLKILVDGGISGYLFYFLNQNYLNIYILYVFFSINCTTCLGHSIYLITLILTYLYAATVGNRIDEQNEYLGCLSEKGNISLCKVCRSCHCVPAINIRKSVLTEIATTAY